MVYRFNFSIIIGGFENRYLVSFESDSHDIIDIIEKMAIESGLTFDIESIDKNGWYITINGTLLTIIDNGESFVIKDNFNNWLLSNNVNILFLDKIVRYFNLDIWYTQDTLIKKRMITEWIKKIVIQLELITDIQ